MRESVRRVAFTVADAFTEGLDLTTVVLGGIAGGWAGYTYYPAAWSDDWRLPVSIAVALIGAVMVNGLADLFLMPMRRQLGKARRPLPTSIGHTAPPAPTTLGEGLAQVAAATADDAAHRAANGAFRIDQGENFLRDERRWRGYEDGEASFYLAPGVVLHYGSTEDRYGRDPHFTLLTGEGDQPVTITSLEQIRHHLAARAAGLPLAPAPADKNAYDSTDAGDDLTGLHAI